MPLDFSFDCTPNFRDLTQTGLVLLRQPVVRTLADLRRLRRGQPLAAARAPRAPKTFAGTR